MSSVSALDAAVKDIKTVILNEGRISAAGISNIIDRSNANVAFIHKYFPNAAGSSVITDKVQATLDELNIGEDNLLYAQSVCPDEINHDREGCITTDFINTFGGGKCFHLGGLGGIPFTGKTGWGAFTHHIPDGGNAFVLQAPHIGMSNSLKLGQFTRDGQSHDGSACGAAVGALNHCCSGQPVPDLTECPDDDLHYARSAEMPPDHRRLIYQFVGIQQRRWLFNGRKRKTGHARQADASNRKKCSIPLSRIGNSVTIIHVYLF